MASFELNFNSLCIDPICFDILCPDTFTIFIIIKFYIESVYGSSACLADIADREESIPPLSIAPISYGQPCEVLLNRLVNHLILE